MVISARTIVILAFASLCLVTYPIAVASHMHLYADGSYYLTRLIEEGRVSMAGHSFLRYAHHFMTQSPALLALRCGVRNLSVLSWIYGATLYYLPLSCYVLAAWLLLRRRMFLRAVLLSLMVVLLSCLTSYFMISESHLAAALFVLTLSVIVTRDMARPIPLLVLTGLGITCLSCYGFWAFYFPTCLALFVATVWRRRARRPVRALQSLVVTLYLCGAVLNTVGVLFSRFARNRDAMFSSHLAPVWPIVLAACLSYGAIVLYGLLGPARRAWPHLRPSRAGAGLRGPGSPRVWVREAAFGVCCLAVMAAFASIYFLNLPRPGHAYSLRSLNLLLPLTFASSLFPWRGRTTGHEPARAIALFCLLPLLVLTTQAELYQEFRWRDFRQSVLAAAEGQSGYVSESGVRLEHPEFLWGHYSPSLSIYLQAMDRQPIRGVLFDPKSSWQPYGPADLAHGRLLARRLNSAFLVVTAESLAHYPDIDDE